MERDLPERLLILRHKIMGTPLPLRVHARALFPGAFLEAFSAMVLSLIFRSHVTLARKGPELPPVGDEVQEVVATFRETMGSGPFVDGEEATARMMLSHALIIRIRRAEVERAIWLRTINAATFLGSIVQGIIVAASIIVMMTRDSHTGVVLMALCYLCQFLAAMVCRRGWHVK